MAEFRTTFTIPKAQNKISLDSQLITLGSCFADVVGNQLKNNKLKIEVNPLGTLFNPLSIFKVLSPDYQFADERLFIENQSTWFHYDFHSQFFASSKAALAERINENIKDLSTKLQSANFVLITFGTAFIYKLLSNPVYVANCHKMPNKFFEKDLLSVKDICKSFAMLHKQLKAINPDLRIILTLSPVRHTKEGIPENQISKSILRAACHYLTADYTDVEYFPAYELMMDDLRDYRFYKADLIHPNEVAETYIYEKFADTYFDDELKSFIVDWNQIKKRLTHRPFNEHSEAHQQFLSTLLADLEKISARIDVSEEIKEVMNKLL
ncbi:GSCFA domain-containing protein [Arcicella sp. DC2W]|uniref:GSCFA domain-containing protein n=1 Tax=Arcicella gelida TaxID=2984195 RepID=A0ABU5RZP5_9BACT|nr:GSCFA domain-containing protein [Arcicella sp. DC2W]MEA5401676.1 GSCFA domain-containing protein [Arcicella sp. DC2W]